MFEWIGSSLGVYEEKQINKPAKSGTVLVVSPLNEHIVMWT